jgi:hypothetical protein
MSRKDTKMVVGLQVFVFCKPTVGARSPVPQLSPRLSIQINALHRFLSLCAQTTLQTVETVA